MLQWNPPTEFNPLTPVYHIWYMQVFNFYIFFLPANKLNNTFLGS